MKRILFSAVASAILGIGLVSVQSQPVTTVKLDNQKTSSDPAQTVMHTDATPVETTESVNPTSAQESSTQPVISPEIMSPPASQPEPVQVVVTSAAPRNEVQGLQTTYYCDLIYTDESTGSIQVGQSQSTPTQHVNQNYTCDAYIGNPKL